MKQHDVEHTKQATYTSQSSRNALSGTGIRYDDHSIEISDWSSWKHRLQILDQGMESLTAAEALDELERRITPWKRDCTLQCIVRIACEWGSAYLPAARIDMSVKSPDQQLTWGLKHSKYGLMKL